MKHINYVVIIVKYLYKYKKARVNTVNPLLNSCFFTYVQFFSDN